MIKILYIFVTLIILHGCSSADIKIIDKKNYLNSKYSAIVIQKNFGATVPFVYKVLVCEDETIPPKDCTIEAFKADKIDGNQIDIDWIAENKLVIKAPSNARIFHYQNFGYLSKENKTIEIKLIINE